MAHQTARGPVASVTYSRSRAFHQLLHARSRRSTGRGSHDYARLFEDEALRGGAAVKGPHQNQPVRVAGLDLSQARGAMVLLHGRGATAESILSLVPALGLNDFAYLAPQAGGN